MKGVRSENFLFYARVPITVPGRDELASLLTFGRVCVASFAGERPRSRTPGSMDDMTRSDLTLYLTMVIR